MNDALGWAASAVFLSSYFFREPATLRRIQAGAAVLWTVYGVVLDAPPMIVANIVVAGVALWSSYRGAKAPS